MIGTEDCNTEEQNVNLCGKSETKKTRKKRKRAEDWTVKEQHGQFKRETRDRELSSDSSQTGN